MNLSDTLIPLRDCLRPAILEIEQVAQLMNNAVTAHLEGDRETASALFKLAENPIVRAWTESLWGKGSSASLKLRSTPGPSLPEEERYQPRKASRGTQRLVHARDGYYCRFCGNPVVRADVRRAIHREYPDAVSWDPDSNKLQHAGLQCLWAQYDHLYPHQRGGTSEIDNIVLTCAGCNYGKGFYTVDELGLVNPLTRPPRAVQRYDIATRFARLSMPARAAR